MLPHSDGAGSLRDGWRRPGGPAGAQQGLGDQHEAEGGEKHHRADCIDLERHAAADRREDVDRQGGVRSGDEEGNDEVLEGEVDDGR
jgi:hypothetical protein